MTRILTAGITEINPLKFDSPYKRIQAGYDMSYCNKPNGCLWGSTMLHNEKYLSDWLRWVSSEDFHIGKYRKAISYTLKRKAKVYTIDTPEDYRNLMRKYSKKKYSNEPLSEFNTKVIDWIKLSMDYDAFHLTKKAFWLMRLPYGTDILKDEDGNYMENFYSYDCETWIIFNLDCVNMGSIFNHNINLKALHE